MDILDMPAFDLQAAGYFTRGVDYTSHVLPLCDAVRHLFEEEDVRVVWLEERGTVERLMSEVSSSTLRVVCDHRAETEQMIGFSDPEGRAFWASVVWNRVRGQKEIDRFVNAVGYRQNRLHVDVMSRRFEEPSFVERYVETCCRLAVSFPLNYLQTRPSSEPMGIPPGNLGLGAGLCALFWLNVFGLPFTNLLGEERILATPAHRAERLAPGVVLLQLTPSPLSADLAAARKEARAYIGEDYFIDRKQVRQPRPGKGGAEVVSIWSPSRLLKMLKEVSEGGSFADSSFFAKKRPFFNFSEIFIQK